VTAIVNLSPDDKRFWIPLVVFLLVDDGQFIGVVFSMDCNGVESM
jgi:hypothetical protein